MSKSAWMCCRDAHETFVGTDMACYEFDHMCPMYLVPRQEFAVFFFIFSYTVFSDVHRSALLAGT